MRTYVPVAGPAPAQTSLPALPGGLHLMPVLPTTHARLGAPLAQMYVSPRRRHAAATTRWPPRLGRPRGGASGPLRPQIWAHAHVGRWHGRRRTRGGAWHAWGTCGPRGRARGGRGSRRRGVAAPRPARGRPRVTDAEARGGGAGARRLRAAPRRPPPGRARSGGYPRPHRGRWRRRTCTCAVSAVGYMSVTMCVTF